MNWKHVGTVGLVLVIVGLAAVIGYEVGHGLAVNDCIGALYFVTGWQNLGLLRALCGG